MTNTNDISSPITPSYWRGLVSLCVERASADESGDFPPNLSDTARLIVLLHSGSHRAARRYAHALGWNGSMGVILEVIGRGMNKHGVEAVRGEVERQVARVLAIFKEGRPWTGTITD